MSFFLKQVFIIDQDTLRLILSDDASVTESLLVATNYSITPLDGGTSVEVKYVLQPEELTTDNISIVITKPELGKKYKAEIRPSSIFNVSGEPITNVSAEWVHGRTKVDSALSSLQKMFDSSPNSNIRFFMQAIMISDENISGQVEYKESRPGGGVSWGGSNWGGNDWGA